MRSLQLVPTRRSHIDAAAAARASALAIESSMLRHEMDFSLCHGLAGIAEFLILAAHQLGDHRIGVTAHELARSRAVRFGSSPKAWPCGVASGSNPSLMLGLAGIGYFYLRLSDPTVLSVLLPVPETSGRKALSN
jgi:lantibiotic modifying enzyme